MIGFFPEIYEDELLYSQLCRYYQRTGYTRYIFAIDDLFMHRTVHPVIEWVNEYTHDAMAHITKDSGFETMVRMHTMFPAYTRFLPKERRSSALRSLLTCDGNYYNLIAGQTPRKKRYLRYCPDCAKEDRKRFGETYWHRKHQIIHVDICPQHKCYLMDSMVQIGSKVKPGLFPAETEVPFNMEPVMCRNDHLVNFAQYVIEVFNQPVDMKSDVLIGSFLRSKLDDKYKSPSKMKIYITKLYEDFYTFFREIEEPMAVEPFCKIYNNYSLNHYQICQLAYFQRISVNELVKRPVVIVHTAMEELYHDLEVEYGIDYETVSRIGEAVISRYHKLGKVCRKSGPKQREWAVLDEKYLPRVKEVVDRIYSVEGKPDRVSITRVEREIGAPCKQFQKLPKCTQYIQEHLETNNEYRARKVEWAVKLFHKEGRYMSLNKIIRFLNFRKNDFYACVHLISDPEVNKIIDDLLTETELPVKRNLE